MSELNFNIDLKYYVENVLNNIPVIPNTTDVFSDVVLEEFRLYYSNGELLEHLDGEHYAIAVFNCIAKQDVAKIVEFLKSDNFEIDDLKSFVDNLKLKKYIHGNTQAYRRWQSGDVGTVRMTFDEQNNKYKIDGFANHYANERNVDLRKNPHHKETDNL